MGVLAGGGGLAVSVGMDEPDLGLMAWAAFVYLVVLSLPPSRRHR
jgi:hypothetical protein